MANIYVDAQSGDDLNAGTESAPLRTLEAAAAIVEDYDRVYLRGDFEPYEGGDITQPLAPFQKTGLASVVVTKWPGSENLRPWIKGSCRLYKSGTTEDPEWEVHDGDCWKTDLDTGAVALVGVAAIPLSFIESDGRTVMAVTGPDDAKWHLRAAVDATDCVDTAYSWFYDASGNLLYVNMNGDTLTDFAFEWCPDMTGGATGSKSRIAIEDSTNCRVYDLSCMNLIDASHGDYFIKMSGTGNQITDCTGVYAGWHAFGHVASSTGIACVNCTVERVLCIGGGDGANASEGCKQVVFYANDTNVTGCTWSGEFHCYALRDPDGVYFTYGQPVDGVYAHTGGTSKVKGLVGSDSEFYHYQYNTGTWFSVGDFVRVQPADGMDPDSYGIQCIDCTFTDYSAGLRALTNCAYQRCLFVAAEYFLASGNALGYFLQTGTGSTSAGVTCLLDACHVAALTGASDSTRVAELFAAGLGAGGGGTGGGGYDHAILKVWNGNGANPGSDVFLRNTNLVHVQTATGGNAAKVISVDGSTASTITMSRVVARECIFVGPANGTNKNLLTGDSSLTHDRLDFKGCWYYSIGSTVYSALSTRNADTEWQALIDPTTTPSSYGTSPAFVSAFTSAEPGAAVKAFAAAEFANHTERGINGLLYNGLVGAWQNGDVPRSGTRNVLIPLD